MYHVLSLPIKQQSKAAVFVDTNPKSESIAVLKYSVTLSQLEDDDTDVFQKSLVSRYVHRPYNLQHMCLAEFAATFVTNYKSEDDGDELPPPKS